MSQQTMSVEEYRAQLKAAPRRKYGNSRVMVDGHMFDSKAEANRYLDLKTLQYAGEIRDLELHPSFVLQKSFRYEGKTERAIRYEADFAYTDSTGLRVVEDVKGKRTQAYCIKRKLFLAKYGHEVEFREIEV